MSQPEDKKPVPPRDVRPLVSANEVMKAGLGPQIELKGGPRDEIAVEIARFSKPLQYPGKGSDTQVKSETLTNGTAWEVVYVISMRQFRVTYTDPARKIRRVGYVMGEHVTTWDPVQ